MWFAPIGLNPPLHFVSDFRKIMVDEALVNMIIKDSQPFSIVEDVGFKELIHALDPSYVLPTRQVCMVITFHLLLQHEMNIG